jgi:hypothetical protein
MEVNTEYHDSLQICAFEDWNIPRNVEEIGASLHSIIRFRARINPQ